MGIVQLRNLFQPDIMSLQITTNKTDTKNGKVTLVKSSLDTTVQLVSSKKVNNVDHGHIMHLAEQISNSNSHVKAATTNKLQSIAEQIKRLQQEAVQCLENAKRDKQLHEAGCNLVKKPGTVYHLYEKMVRGSGTTAAVVQAYFSIMSPEDWGRDMPHKFLGSYRLGYDLQFTPVQELTEERLKQERAIDLVYEQYTTGGVAMLEGGASFAGAMALLG